MNHHQYYADPGDLMGTTRIPAGYASSASGGAATYQYRIPPGSSPMNELDNFSTLGTLRHHPPPQTGDPYYDAKQMKQKLLSVNVPESCVWDMEESGDDRLDDFSF